MFLALAESSEVLGWADGRTPLAPAGFKVTKYAEGLKNPRRLYLTPGGDVLLAESNSNHSTLEKILGTLAGASKSNRWSDSANRISLLKKETNLGCLGIQTVEKIYVLNTLHFKFLSIAFSQTERSFDASLQLVVVVRCSRIKNGTNSASKREQRELSLA